MNFLELSSNRPKAKPWLTVAERLIGKTQNESDWNQYSAGMWRGRRIAWRERMMLVTPELADILLQRNTMNRKLRIGGVIQMCRDMENGNFMPTAATTIAFDSDGNLINGQHTLSAIVDSECPQWVKLVVGCDPEMRDFWDLTRGRTVPDRAGICGVIQPGVACSAARLILAFDNGGILDAWSATKTPTPTEVLNATRDLPNLDESVRAGQRNGLRKLVPARIAVTCHYLFARQNRGLADAFLEKLGTGENLPGNSPIYQLRKMLIDNDAERRKMQRYEMLALFFIAWTKHKTGKRVRRLRWVAGVDPFPEI